MFKFHYFLFISCIILKVLAVPPSLCRADFRWDDCGKPPKAVMYYWKSGSRCEIGIWKGCLPNPNMFANEYECINTCVFVDRPTLRTAETELETLPTPSGNEPDSDITTDAANATEEETTEENAEETTSETNDTTAADGETTTTMADGETTNSTKKEDTTVSKNEEEDTDTTDSTTGADTTTPDKGTDTTDSTTGDDTTTSYSDS